MGEGLKLYAVLYPHPAGGTVVSGTYKTLGTARGQATRMGREDIRIVEVDVMSGKDMPLVKPKGLTCEDCGTTNEEVQRTICPYDSDINGVDTPAVLCEPCEWNRADDI